MELLRDESFEKQFDKKEAYRVTPGGGVTLEPRMNVFSLPDWDFYYLDALGYVVPEMRDAWKDHDPVRVRSGEKGLVCHVTGKYAVWWGQRFEVPDHGPVTVYYESRNKWAFRNSDTYIDDARVTYEDGVLRASGWMHAWSNHRVPGFEHVGKPYCSVGVGCGPVAIKEGESVKWIYDNIPNATTEMKDAVANFTFAVGIDPEGGNNPLASSVEWGAGWHIYNGYAQELSCVVRIDETEPGPDPDPDPETEWAYQTVKKGSKIGVHSINSNKVGDFSKTLADNGAQFPVIKVVDDLGWIVRIKQDYPDVITIGRYVSQYEGCQDVEFASDSELRTMAKQLIDVILNRSSSEQRAAVDYWEICNEPDPNSVPGYARLAQLMMVCMEMAEERGLKLALFGLNAGTPEWGEMVAMLDTGVFARAKEGGHILTLHEGTFTSHDPKQWWGDLIPGAPEVEGAGALNFRYRYLYSLLKRHDQVIPLVISEWYCGDEASATTKTVVDALKWYDGEASKDYWVWATQPFTLGPTSQWGHTDYERFYPDVLEYMIEIRGRDNALPPKEEEVDKYKRTYRIADPTFMNDEELDLAYALARSNLNTVGPSWQDAVPYEKDRPGEWEDNIVIVSTMPLVDRPRYREWVKNRDPNTKMVFEDSDDDEGDDGELEYIDLVGQLATNPNSTWYPYKKRSMDDPIWVIVHHTAGPKVVGSGVVNHIKSIADAHCFGYRRYPGIAYTFMIDDDGKLYRVNEPETISFAHGREGSGIYENKLGIAVCLIGNFMHEEPSDAAMNTLERTIEYLDDMTSHNLEVGGHKDLAPTDCPGATWPWKDGWGLNPKTPLLVGLHDGPGGEWMVKNNIEGTCLVHTIVQQHKRVLDYRQLSDNGVRVICRLNWGYADGTGTVPPSSYANAWISAMSDTINDSHGVWGWTIANEVNNPVEWPGSYPNPYFIVSPEYYIGLYNSIRDRTDARLAPFSVDPYNVVAGEFSQPNDPKVWVQRVYNGITGMDFIALHAKTQSNDPSECWSNAEFSHAPLIGRKLHLRTVEDQIDWIPDKYAHLPKYVKELNPQRKLDGGLGWESDNSEWIRQSLAYLRTQGIDGVMFYRFELAGGGQEGFAMVNKPTLLGEIRKEAEK